MRRLVPIIGVLTIIAWASAYPLVRLAMTAVPSVPLAALRYALAAFCAVLWLCCKRLPVPALADWPRLVACGLSGITFYNIFFNLGERHVSSATTSLIIALAPIMAGLIAVIWCRERLTVWSWIGSFLSFGGVLVIVLGHGGHVPVNGDVVLVFLAAFCMAVFSVLQKPLVQHYGGMVVTCWVLIIGSVALSPWLGQGMVALLRSPPKIWLYVLELALVPAVLGYAGWSVVVGALGAARAVIFLYLVPPVTFILSFLLEGSWPDLPTLLGGGVVMFGVSIAQLLGRRKSRPVED